MKKHFKNIGLLMVLALYCFAISLHSSFAADNLHAFSKPVSTEPASYNKTVTAGSFFHTNQSEVSGAVFISCQPAPVRHTHNDIVAGCKATEQLFSHRFLQYSFYSKNLQIPLQKTALIFPFHYFW